MHGGESLADRARPRRVMGRLSLLSYGALGYGAMQAAQALKATAAPWARPAHHLVFLDSYRSAPPIHTGQVLRHCQ